jgi:predicted metalloprotease with PDZ domain
MMDDKLGKEAADGETRNPYFRIDIFTITPQYMYRYLLAFLLLSSPLLAQDILYRVDLGDTRAKKVKVTIELKKSGAETVTYQMPLWAPGAYAQTGYGRFVENFKAYGYSGDEKPVVRVNDNRWQIKHGKDIARIEYEVRTSHKDSTSLYFALAHIDSNMVFASGTSLFGYINDKKNTPSKVVYTVPAGWTLHCALESPKPNEFKAPDYDVLVDAPIMAGPKFNIRNFEYKGTKYEIVLASDKVFPMDSLEELTKKIVRAQVDFWGDQPFKNYSFLIFAPTFLKSPSLANGALEHANSSAYLLLNMPWKNIKENYAHIISHELFHAWNVKLIHSDKLGPFDYTQPVRTTSIWLSEGITDYYAHLLLSRYGILTEDDFENTVIGWQYQTNMSKDAKTSSLEQLSLEQSDFDLKKATSFYSKGPLVGFMLDLEIRNQTTNKYSLDNAMFELYKRAKKGNHFKDEELIGIIERSTKTNLKDFYRKYIAGVDSLPLGMYAAYMGTELMKRTVKQHGIHTGVKMSPTADSSAYLIKEYINDDLKNVGAMIGDTILTLNDTTFTWKYFKQYSNNTNAPQKVNITLGTPRGRRTISATLTKFSNETTTTDPVAIFENQTPLQAAIQKGIYGKKEGW